jgi:NADH pyrophosphatase NudC (nudix superfamily)
MDDELFEEAMQGLMEADKVRAFCPACDAPLTVQDIFLKRRCKTCRNDLPFDRIPWSATDQLPQS